MPETALPGLSAHPGLAAVPAEELRFCVVLNGGVSLAVWMGGSALELDRLIKAGQGSADSPAYRLMLRLAGATARADVIAGTSAGGINGAALALAQVNRRARIGMLRDLWIDQGQLETLLRQPFRGAPPSLMKGDEYFLPELNAALSMMAAPLDWRSPAEAPIDLTMATTVLKGNQLVTTDALGQKMPQSLHAAQLHWSRWPAPETDPATGRPKPDPFAPEAIRGTVAEMALGARASSSFPIAFEPAFVPVGENPLTSPRTREDRAVRPEMQSAVVAWGNSGPDRDRSRFVVDGGLLANTPTAYALKAIQALPAAGPVRRVMMLVYPHAPEPGLDPPDDVTKPPSMTDTVTGLLGALSAQGGRTFVEEIEDHNRTSAGRRGTRSDILATVAHAQDQTLESLSTTLYPHYRRLRKWRAARDLSQRKLDRLACLTIQQQELAPDWSYERIRHAAERAQDWLDEPRARDAGQSTVTPSAAGMTGGLPYVPSDPPTEASPDAGPAWGWGVTGAARIAEAAGDVLRRLVWMLQPGPAYDAVSAARSAVSTTAALIDEARLRTDAAWDTDPVLLSLEPSESYWTFRLGCYGVLMLGEGDEGLDDLLAQIVAAEGNRTYADAETAAAEGSSTSSVTPSGDLMDGRRATVQKALTDWWAEVQRQPGAAGAELRGLVLDVVNQLRDVVVHLRAAVDTDGEAEKAIATDARLDVWRQVLVPGDGPVSTELLLTRLLQLEVASSALGDEVASGSTHEVELVQLSAQTQNGFTRYTRSADDKLGGMSVKRFGGFLKRSWRLNDWIWGRLDAATVLCLTVLHPARVRRAAVLSGYLAQGTPADLAARTVDAVVTELFPGSPVPSDPRVLALRERAVTELTDCFDIAGTPPGNLPSSMPALAGLFAWAVHLDVVPSDIGALVAAIKADAVDGSNSRAHGQFFLEQNSDLLSRVTQTVDQAGVDQVEPGDRAKLLTAFDRAGIGREPLKDEVSSDLLLRSATTAAAVGATALDSPRSGLGALRPVTRAIRGAMLVVFWAMTGLTAKAVIARSLALLGLAFGAVLVVLSVFGALPSAISAPASAIGASLLLLGFCYGALRSGTMLHGLVLLTPIVPLVADAFQRLRMAPESAGAQATHGLLVVGAIVLLALGLMLLGSLPASVASPYAVLGNLATRMGVPQIAQPSDTLVGHLLEGSLRRAKGLWIYVVRLGWRLFAIGVLFLLGWWVVTAGWNDLYWSLRDHWALCVVVGVALALVGVAGAAYTGFALQTLSEDRSASRLSWRFLRVAHPAGVQAGWSALYGIVYLAVGLLIVRDPFGWRGSLWAQSLCAVCLLLGIVLTLVVPFVVPLWALGEVKALERVRAAKVPPFVATAADYDGAGPAEISPDQAFTLDLIHRDRAFRWWVEFKGDGQVPTLKKRGTKMRTFVDQGRSAPPS